MERELVPNNTTLASLRGLLREARENAVPEEAVFVELMLWDYGRDTSDGSDGRITEHIGVYKSGAGEGTQKLKSLEEASDYIKGWKEEDANAHRLKSASSVED